MQWIYGINITLEDHDYVVTIRDLPEVVTAGDTLEQALELAADAIEVIVTGRMKDESALPFPSPIQKGEYEVALGAQVSAKASVYTLWLEAHMSKTKLAQLLGCAEGEARRILNPKHTTRLDQMQAAAKVLGGSLMIGFARA